jgi:hypothetical protein
MEATAISSFPRRGAGTIFVPLYGVLNVNIGKRLPLRS